MPRTMRVSIEERHCHQQRHRRPKPAIVSPYLGIKYYTKQIQADPTLFTCPHCNETLTSRAFEVHCICKHALDARLCCVWCYGSVSWRRWRKKKNHVGHLIACWRSFLATVASPLLLSPTTTAPSPSSSSANDPLLQPPRNEYVWDLPDRAFELVWLLPVKPHLLTFQDPALKPAVSAVKMFLDHTNSDTSTMTTTSLVTTTTTSDNSSSCTTTSNSSRFTTTANFSSTSFSSTSFSSTSYRSTITGISSSVTVRHDSTLPPLEWFHVAVTKQAYERFLHMMDRYEGDFSTLPYSCWCMTQMDGTCHRHFIVVAKITNEFLKNVHRQQQFGATCIRIARIETVLQLVDTLGDLGNQRRIKNQCPFPSSSSSDRIHAYYALARLPGDFRLVLLMQWNNGVLQDDLYRELTSSGHTTNNNRGKRMVDMKLRALNYVSRDDFIPSQYPTGYALHLIWGEKVYFKRKLSGNNDDDEDAVARIRPSNALTPAAVLPKPKPRPSTAAAEAMPVGPAAAGPVTPVAAARPPVKWKRVKLKNCPIQVRLQPRL